MVLKRWSILFLSAVWRLEVELDLAIGKIREGIRDKGLGESPQIGRHCWSKTDICWYNNKYYRLGHVSLYCFYQFLLRCRICMNDLIAKVVAEKYLLFSFFFFLFQFLSVGAWVSFIYFLCVLCFCFFIKEFASPHCFSLILLLFLSMIIGNTATW